MRFSLADQLGLPCIFERFVPGELHTDGRRYLPLIVLRLLDPGPETVATLVIVDRHHLVDPSHVGRTGSASLLYLLSKFQLTERRSAGLFDHALQPNQPSGAPEAYGRVAAIGAWEVANGNLPYETLYAEFLLDLGFGSVGVRTSATAENLATQLGTKQLAIDEWVYVKRSRIDILSFQPNDL